MENLCNEKNRDFSIIFKEIDEFKIKNPYITSLFKNEEVFNEDETIRAFGEICQEINSSSNQNVSFTTFS